MGRSHPNASLRRRVRLLLKARLLPRLESAKEQRWQAALTDLLSCGEDMRFPWWLDDGTLLAVVRDGQLLPNYYDNDIDMGVVWASDTAPQIVAWTEAVERSGRFRVNRHYHSVSFHRRDDRFTKFVRHRLDRFRLTWMYHVPIHMHFWRHSEAIDGYWSDSGSFSGPWFWPQVIRGRDLRMTSTRALARSGLLVNVPNDPEAHVENAYGPGWRIPAIRAVDEWSDQRHGAYRPDEWDADWFQNWT